jgi:hypothetical protein
MLKKIIASLFIAATISVGGASLVTVAPTSAAAKDQILSGTEKVNDGNKTDLSGSVTQIINLMLFLIGAIAVIVIIIGGIRYTTSSGDQGAVQSAKNTIMYAVIGLIVAILAYAIVNFVVKTFK